MAQNFPHRKKKALRRSYLDVSGNSGFPPKSSILIGFSSTFTIHFGGPPLFLENTHLASLSRNGLMASSLEPPPQPRFRRFGFLHVESQFLCLVGGLPGYFPQKKCVKSSYLSPKSSMWSWILKDFQVESSHHSQNISYWLRIHRCPLGFSIPIQMAMFCSKPFGAKTIISVRILSSTIMVQWKIRPSNKMSLVCKKGVIFFSTSLMIGKNIQVQRHKIHKAP